jgi:hypothetical protein
MSKKFTVKVGLGKFHQDDMDLQYHWDLAPSRQRKSLLRSLDR